jgi:glycosyltransferase involved in cell wall biosynthesis
MKPPVVALVTAYNEAETIGAVVRVLRASPGIDRVHVLDDASTDATAEVARAAGAAVRTLPVRVPVGEALRLGAEGVAEPDALLFFCDADLIGLRPDHVADVLAPVLGGAAQMSVGVKDSFPLTPWTATAVATRLFGAARADAVISWVVRRVCLRHGLLLGGERVLPRAMFLEAYDSNRTSSGYGLVIVLNAFVARRGGRTAATFLRGCTHREKFQKWTVRDALPGMARLLTQIAGTWLRVWALPAASPGTRRGSET